MNLILLPMAVFSIAAFGAEVPDREVLSAILEFILNFKTWGVALSGMSLIVILMNILNKYVGSFPLKTVVVVVLATAYGVFQMLAGGQGLFEAFFTVLVSGGGAMKIYDAIRAYVESK